VVEEGHKEMLTLRLFGSMEVSIAGKPLPRLRTRKGRWLLALLALRHGQEVERSWLAGVLWPESLEEQALTNLRLSLSDLRSALGDQACRLQSPAPRTLRLDLSGADVDVLAFDNANACGDITSLQKAVALYRGPLLEGCVEEWSLLERQAREQAYLSALETLAARAMAKADTAAAIGYLRQIAAIDPFRESAHRALMQALAAAGDYAAAVAVYRDLRLRLHRELHSEPDAQTQALFHQIRARARSAGKLSVPGLEGMAASGEKPLTPPGMAAAPADLPGGLPPSNLPVLWTSFIGRETEREEVESLLAQTRLLSLTGSGGCGKTRLALQVASEALEDYPDGVWLVELASLSDADLVVQEVASAVGAREEPGCALLQTLTEHLRPKHLLLLLDNCEHLLPACARLAETLLKHCPHVKVLATSREALRLPGEQVYRVPSLPAPDPAQLPQQEKEIAAIVSEYDAVRLFVERARLQKPAFTLTPQNAPVVASVCHRLDGIPLAIELAAGRAPVLSVEEIHARLEDRFRLLAGGSRSALPRQQTLRAALDWSYDLLTPKERRLLQRLNVFAGGFTWDAIEAVCSDEEVNAWEALDLLASLVEKSVVMAEEREGETRYRLLETIREYAWERLRETEEETGWRDRHLQFFLGLAEAAEPNLNGAEQAQWLERLESEHDNLRAALSWCRQERSRAEMGLRLAGALWGFWKVRGHYSEGREHLQEALARNTVCSLASARARALQGAGVLSAEQGDYPVARTLLEESLAIRRKLEDRQGIASSLNNLGRVAYEQGDIPIARSLYEQSLALSRELGDRQGMAQALLNLAGTTRLQGDFATTRALCEEGLALSRELGDRQGMAQALINLGIMAKGQGDYAAARALYEQSLAITRELGDKSSIAITLNNLGNVVHAQGDSATANALYEESLSLRREIGDRQGVAESLNNLGNVAYQLGDHAAARALCEESLVLSRALGDRQGMADALMILGDATKERGDYPVAWALCEEGLAISREIEDRQGMVYALLSLGDMARQEGDYARARALCEEGLAIGGELGDKYILVGALIAVADVAIGQGQPQLATRLWAAAEALREAIGSPIPPDLQAQHDRQIAAAHDSLGDAAFEKAWKEGWAMTVEEAIATAQKAKEPESKARPSG